MKPSERTDSKSLVIGLDCSTTGTKAIAFDRKGRIAAAAHEANPLFSSKPGYYEQNAQDCWHSARKALGAVTGSVDPKRIAAHRGHIYRSMLKGIAFEQFPAIQSVEKAIGREVRSLVAIGSGASSELWLTILADITGKNICLPKNTEASALGAAIAAAVGAGWHASFQEAANAMTGIHKTIRPDWEHNRKYQALFQIYKRLYPCFKAQRKDCQ